MKRAKNADLKPLIRWIQTSNYYCFASDTGVGAIRLFFAWPWPWSWPSPLAAAADDDAGADADASSFSFSLSLASRSLLTPAVAVCSALPLLLRGVSGGVVMGTPVTLPEWAAAMDGMLPPISGGLLMTLEDCVAIEEVEFERAGDVGRTLVKDAVAETVPVGGGDGAANELAEFRCWWPCGKGDGGANTAVGVGTGVGLFEVGPTPAVLGALPASSPV